MREFFLAVLVCLATLSTPSFCVAQMEPGQKLDLTQPQDYVLKRISSYDRSGANDDFRQIEPGSTLTVFHADGPGTITHIWMTLASPETYHLKKLVLRMYWDNESAPSVEAPLGDFFGLGLGEYHIWESQLLSVGNEKALNSFFQMPFQKHSRITVTNEGALKVDAFYFNVDYRALARPLLTGTLYFHAQFRQAQPNHGWTTDWVNNGDPRVNDVKNLDGKDNYVWMEATGRGHYVGVTMSVFQNQDDWWGEGDDMFFLDGERVPSINGTGSEDYFLGAYGFGDHAFIYQSYGAAVKGEERAGSRSSVYRFHLDSPITFTKSIRATIEHGHANHRSDNFYSVAYWYQSEAAWRVSGPSAGRPAHPAIAACRRPGECGEIGRICTRLRRPRARLQ